MPGPDIPVDHQVDWSYIVTNTGNTTLHNLAVTDAETLPSAAPGPAVSCPETTLGVGESMTCTATGVSGTLTGGGTFVGQYGNLAAVTAIDSHGTPVGPVTDPSHYFVVAPGIQVEKATNGEDADDLPGPLVAPGDPVTWTYVVANTGTEALNNVEVTDAQGVSVTCPGGNPIQSLAVGASVTCSGSGTATSGQYANRATATGEPALGGGSVTDQDPSHYFGVEASLTLEKATNGHDPDNPRDGPSSSVTR